MQLALKHRDFKEPVHVTLKTDAAGPRRPRAARRHRERDRDRPRRHGAHLDAADRPAHLPAADSRQGRRGGRAAVPRHGRQAGARRTRAVRGARRRRSAPTSSTRSRSRTGWSSCAASPPGDYDLWLKRSGEKIRIRVADGAVRDGYVLGQRCGTCELPGLKPVQIETIDRGRGQRHGQAAGRVEVRPRPRLRDALSAGVLGVRQPGARCATRSSDGVVPAARGVGVPDRPQHRRRVPLRARPPQTRRSTPATCSTGRRCCSTRGRCARPRPASNWPSGGDEFGQRGGVTPARRRPPASRRTPPEPDVGAARAATSPTSTSSPTPRRCAVNLTAGQGRRRQAAAQGPRAARDDPRRRRRSARTRPTASTTLPEMPANVRRPAAARTASTRQALHAAEAGDASPSRASRSRSTTSRAAGSRRTTAWRRSTASTRRSRRTRSWPSSRSCCAGRS